MELKEKNEGDFPLLKNKSLGKALRSGAGVMGVQSSLKNQSESLTVEKRPAIAAKASQSPAKETFHHHRSDSYNTIAKDRDWYLHVDRRNSQLSRKVAKALSESSEHISKAKLGEQSRDRFRITSASSNRKRPGRSISNDSSNGKVESANTHAKFKELLNGRYFVKSKQREKLTKTVADQNEVKSMVKSLTNQAFQPIKAKNRKTKVDVQGQESPYKITLAFKPTIIKGKQH